MLEILDIPLYDDGLLQLALRFAHNAVFMALVVCLARHPQQGGRRDREFAFAMVMLNITVFFVCFTMQKMELSLGMALGLFAIFGVLRYRSDTICTKDMTYLFIVIGIAVVNALANTKTSYLELLGVNVTLVLATMLVEGLTGLLRRPKASDTSDAANAPERNGKRRKQFVEYDSLELLAPERRDDLIADLRRRTHLPIDRVRINSIDLPNGRASLSVWYDEELPSE